ncbi:regulatory protein RecX [gamma proteobacterium HTCC5015]|nr:regulatory protein RecX [gamma proteobacterium HTCC5015]
MGGRKKASQQAAGRLSEADSAAVRLAAMDALARREHSRYELINKLCAKGADTALAEKVLEQLREENLQSDQRFVEDWVNNRYRRGQGPMKVRAELSQHQLEGGLVESQLSRSDLDWFEAARLAYQKKYGTQPIDDYNERAKRMRFLQGRGFYAEHIQYALSAPQSGEQW